MIYETMNSLVNEYYLIIPAMDGCYDGANDFTTFADQCKQIEDYIQTNLAGKLDMVYWAEYKEREHFMMTVKKSSVFPASEEVIFGKLQKLETLQYIAYPYATFIPIDETDELIWEEGSSNSFRFKIFGLIPFGIHTINVIRFGKGDGIYTNEGNQYVPIWNHEIILEKLDESHTKYTDIVDIEAGWKTVFVYQWAKAFYMHRQKKWLKLLKQRYA